MSTVGASDSDDGVQVAKAITSHDVARAAGVSQATVSRALRNLPGTAPHTRAAVLEAAAKLSYLPSDSARSLATRSTRRVAVVAEELTNPYYPQLVAPIQRHLFRAGLRTVLVTDSRTADPGATWRDGGRPRRRQLRRRDSHDDSPHVETASGPDRALRSTRLGEPRPGSPRVAELHRGQRGRSSCGQLAGGRAGPSPGGRDPRSRSPPRPAANGRSGCGAVCGSAGSPCPESWSGEPASATTRVWPPPTASSTSRRARRPSSAPMTCSHSALCRRHVSEDCEFLRTSRSSASTTSP